MALAGLMFAATGFSGMINAGMNINYLVHNTFWVVGHFHLTVLESVVIGLVLIVAILVWAFWPDTGTDGPTSDSSPR